MVDDEKRRPQQHERNSTGSALAGFSINLPITIRLAQREDLAKLEWNGQYAHLRGVMARTLQEQRRGARFLLVAVVNDFPIGTISGQIRRSEWLYPGKRRAYFYSLRVLDLLHGHGIGSHLLTAAESHVSTAGCVASSIAAAKDNAGARRLYERHGYQIVAEDPGEWSYVDHLGKTRQMQEPCWILEKTLTMR